MLRKLSLLFVFLFAGLALPASAQSSQENFTSLDGRITLNYPSGWFVTEDRSTVTILTAQDLTLSDNIPLAAGNAAFSLHVFSRGSRSPLNNTFRGTTPLDKLQNFLDSGQQNTNLGVAQSVTVGSHPAAQSIGEYPTSHNQVELLLVDFENSGYGLIVIVTAPGDLNRLQPKMDSIAASIVYTPLVSTTSGPVNINGLVPINQTNAGDLKTLSIINAHSGSANTVAISPDVQTIASGGDDGAILLWDAASGEQKPSPDTQNARIQQVLFTPDGQQLISASDDGTVRLWDATTGEQQQMKQEDGSIFYIAISPDSKLLAFISYISSQVGTRSSTVWLWNLQTGDTQTVEDMPIGFFANSLAFGPDGQQLLYSASDTNNHISIGLYDVTNQKAAAHWSGRGSPIDVFFTVDVKPMVSIASGTRNGDVTIWDPQTDNFLFTMSGHQDTVYQTIANAARTMIGTPSFDGTARLWDIQTGDMLGVLQHNASVLGIAFSHDDRLLVTSDSAGFLYLWGIVANI